MNRQDKIQTMHNSQTEQPESAQASGLKTSRIEALSDGIFAVAMTLLVLNITPEIIAENRPNPVFDLFIGQGIRLFAYLMSFMVLGFYWVGHHAQFQYIKRVNRPLLWINLGFLFSISFLPFSTAFLAKFEDNNQVEAFYGAHILLTGAILFFHWWYAARTPLITDHLDRNIVRMAARRILYAPAIALFAIGISLIANVITAIPVRVSLVCYAAIPLVYFFPGHIDLHWTRPQAIRAHENNTHENEKQISEADAD
jgi:uncharacterized membrane protein